MDSHDPKLHRRSTDRLKAHEEPFDQASGLAQRALFRERCEQAWEWAQRERLPASALFVHIDRFDAYTLEHGTEQADHLIHAVADGIRSACKRRADFAGRLREDEFGISLTNIGQKGTRLMAQQILDNTQPARLAEAGVAGAEQVSLSVGAACQIPSPHKFAQSLLVEADTALHRARDNGGGQLYANFEEG